MYKVTIELLYSSHQLAKHVEKRGRKNPLQIEVLPVLTDCKYKKLFSNLLNSILTQKYPPPPLIWKPRNTGTWSNVKSALFIFILNWNHLRNGRCFTKMAYFRHLKRRISRGISIPWWAEPHQTIAFVQ